MENLFKVNNRTTALTIGLMIIESIIAQYCQLYPCARIGFSYYWAEMECVKIFFVNPRKSNKLRIDISVVLILCKSFGVSERFFKYHYFAKSSSKMINNATLIFLIKGKMLPNRKVGMVILFSYKKRKMLLLQQKPKFI